MVVLEVVWWSIEWVLNKMLLFWTNSNVKLVFDVLRPLVMTTRLQYPSCDVELIAAITAFPPRPDLS